MSENHSYYDYSEIEGSLGSFHQAKGSWNDNKSREIETKYYSSIQSACMRLIELSQNIQITVNEISDKLDSI